MQPESDPSILHYLTRIGITDDGHISGGMTYLDWQESYRGITGAKTSRYDLAASGDGRDDKASKYLRLVRELGMNYQRDIEDAVKLQQVTRNYHTQLFAIRYRFVKAFDLLGMKISKINDEFGCNEQKTDIAS